MIDSQATRLGINGAFDEEAIDNLLRHLAIPVYAYVVENLNATDFASHDVLMMAAPELDEAKTEEFIKAVEVGLAAMIMVSAERGISARERRLAQGLGYQLEASREFDRIRIEYTEDYPVAAKRGEHGGVAPKGKRAWATFKPLISNYPPSRKTIVNRASLLAKEPYAVEVKLGEGMVIMSDSFCLAEDRADMLSHLLKNAKRHRGNEPSAAMEEVKEALPLAAANLFEVYDEIPFQILAERVGLDFAKVDESAFIGMLETLIRERRIAGRIRRDSLVKQ